LGTTGQGRFLPVIGMHGTRLNPTSPAMERR
jgi:hypothetical protein